MPRKITYKFKRHKRLLLLKRAILVSGAFVLLLFLLVYAMDRTLRVSRIDVTGNERISSEKIKNYALGFLNEKMFFFWPKNNIILFSSENLENFLQKQFSSIDTADVSRNLWEKTVQIQIEERSALAIWCQEECFYMDNSGIIYGQAPRFFGELILKIKDLRPEKFVLGDSVVNQELLKKIEDFMEGLKSENNFITKNIEIKSGLEFWLRSNESSVIVDAETDFGIAGENLKLFLNAYPEKQLKDIEYIDLRFKDKAFYKPI